MFPRALAFDFCYDHDLCSQGHTRESVFHWNGFFSNFVKSTRGILSNMSESFIDRWHIFIVDLQLTYFCIYCVKLKISIRLLFSLSSRINFKLNLVLTGQKPLSTDDNSPDHS